MQVYRPTEPYQCTYDEDKYYLDGKLMFNRNPKNKNDPCGHRERVGIWD